MVGVLLDDQDGEAVLLVQRANGVEDLTRDQGRKTERRLVQEQEARAAHQRAADREHLLLAAGQRAAALRHAFPQPRKQVEHALEGGCAIVLAREGGVRAHLQVLRHAHAREDAAALRRLRDSEPRDLVGCDLRDVASIEQDLSGARARPPEDRHHQRRLPGAVGSDQGHDLAGMDFEVDAFQRFDLAVRRAQVADREQGSGGRHGALPS